MHGGIMTDCMRCGKCCRCDFFAFTRPEDLARWKEQGREDILQLIENENPVWEGDRLISARDGRHLRCCPFLTWEGEKRVCAIYETRPGICREFQPGSSHICPLYRETKTDRGDII